MSDELTPDERWEQGIAHDPRSLEIASALREIDMELDDLHFDWQLGGDGDNGERLAYQLDCYFARKDALEGDGG